MHTESHNHDGERTARIASGRDNTVAASDGRTGPLDARVADDDASQGSGGELTEDAPTRDVRRQAAPSGPRMTVTQAIRLNREMRRTTPPGARARPIAPPSSVHRAAWKDGLFPAVFGAIFSARWIITWVGAGEYLLAGLVGLTATAGLFAIGVGASRWLAQPASDIRDE